MATLQRAISDRLSEIAATRAELDREEAALQSALDVIAGKAASGHPRRASGAKASGRRAPRGQRRQQVLDEIKSRGTARPSEIAKSIGASPNQVSAVLASLRKAKRVRKTKNGYSLTAASKAG